MHHYYWEAGYYYVWTWDSLLEGSGWGLLFGLLAGWCVVDAWNWYLSCKLPSAPPPEARLGLHQRVILACGLCGSLVGAFTLGFRHIYHIT